MPKALKLELQRKYYGRAGLCALTKIVGSEVPIRVAILLESARHSSHKAEDDFSDSSEVSEQGYNPFIYIIDSKSLVVEL